MEVFNKALNKLLEHEGGYVNDPRDSGGETYKGVSRKWFPKWKGWSLIDLVEDKSKLEEVEELQEEVAAFYYAYFWYKIKADRINNALFAEILFITSVNLGKKTAIKKLQRILKVVPDGLVGSKTINALNSANEDKFIYQFVIELVDFYVQVSAKGSNAVFLRGWCNRALSFYYEYERSR